ncbi:hypothetical protein OROGR_025680 [Orobanche gracilis]
MAEADNLEAVLKFLRNNGLSECESALMDDIMEKSQVDSSEFEKFFFPMTPPPPLRIPSPRWIRETSEGGGRRSRSLSDDEFVSLDSSTTEFCSSEFTNPYGIRTTRPSSQSSSDRLSQFGTARDYPNFDMQNDLLWYKEKDEDSALPHVFNGDSTEDKFVTALHTGQNSVNHVPYISDDSIKYHESRESSKDKACNDYYELGELFEPEQSNEIGEEFCNCPVPLFACCRTGGSVYEGPIEYDLGNLKTMYVNEKHARTTLRERMTKSETNLSGDDGYDCLGDFDNAHEIFTNMKDEQKNENDIFYNEPEALVNEESGAISNELLTYETNEDDYEIFDLRIIHRKNRTGFEESKDFPIVMNSVIAGRYYVTEFLGSAAFSKVVQAQDLQSGMEVCIKIVKNSKDFFDQSLDEIKLLKFVNKHDPADERHILRLYDYFYYQEHLLIVTELLRANLYEFQKYNQESGGEPYFTLHRLQVIARQCLEALLYMHDLGIIHCDLKPENILIKSYRRCEIKVIDLGSSCFQTDNLSLYVQSRSYRAPEVMLGLPYDQKIDLWSLGCILAELCSGEVGWSCLNFHPIEVLFPNEEVVMLLARMIGVLGPFDMKMLLEGQETNKYFTEEYDLYYINDDTNKVEYIVPEETSLEHHLRISDFCFVDFIKCLLELNPKRRPTAREALQHPWLSYCYEVNSC